ncbi:MAG: phosphate ABC transporter permease PstA [Pseudomonadales bacterium]
MTIDRRDYGGFVLCSVAGITVIVPLVWMILALAQSGLPGLEWEFLVAAPSQSGRAGGIGPMIVSTALILGVCLAAIIPVGLGTSLYLSQYVSSTSPQASWLGYSLDVLAGTPSIVFALFGYQFFAITLGLGFSILAGGLTLACMTLPLMVRTSEQALRAVPLELHQAGEALALSRPGMIWHVLLPAAMPGIVAGTILSIGRALAETAVLLFTAGYVMRLPGSLLDSGRALSVHIFDMAMNVPGGMPVASRTALVLLTLVILINIGVRRMLLHHKRIYYEQTN